MAEDKKLPADRWSALKQFTAARIALGRNGVSEPLQHSLAFRLAHAHARDAVYAALDKNKLVSPLEQLFPSVLSLQSKATTRDRYLQFPDEGRQLSEAAVAVLSSAAIANTYPTGEPPVVVVIADGLSALAVNRHALPLLAELVQRMPFIGRSICCLVENGRVAIGDAVGDATGARLSLVLIGERPGLSSPDSLGVYITFQPRQGRTDADRNCISNIRPEGLPISAAADQIQFLVGEILQRKISGVSVKAGSTALPNDPRV